MTQQSSLFDQSNEYSQIPKHDDNQGFNIGREYQYSDSDISLQSGSDINSKDYVDTDIQSWEQLLGQTSGIDNRYQDISQTDSTTEQTTSFGFQQSEAQMEDNYQYKQSLSSEEITSEADYETIIRSKHLYYDPNPEVIRKPMMIDPVVYKQNIMVRFLQAPPVPQGPLIIREVRAPQPPPPPPLIIRQRAPPPLSPPPIILRERPPTIPSIMTAKVVIRTLPPIPPPPRSVIVEKLPPLPPKPRDIIIERWIPYEAMHKRKVVVHRAEEFKPYPPPKNIIITYEPVQMRIIRQLERLGVKHEDPSSYSSAYGDSLLETEQLLTQIRELGITDDLSPPHVIDNEQVLTEASSNIDEQNYSYDVTAQQHQQLNDDMYSSNNAVYGDVNNTNYAPTYENLVNGSSSSINYEESSEQQLGQENQFFTNNEEDLPSQLAQYGMTTESIPY